MSKYIDTEKTTAGFDIHYHIDSAGSRMEYAQ